MVEITLKQLESFVMTAELSSFTRAAETLYLTQSTVSTHVAALEQTLGCRLIQRGSRQKVVLTEEGNRVYAEARDILDRSQALQELGSRGRNRLLTLGASTVPGQYLLPELMAGFQSQEPDSRYVVVRGDSAEVQKMLDDGRVRLGFVGAVEDRIRYCCHPVADDRLVLITANREPYCTMKKDGVQGRELLDRPILLREPASGTRRALASYLRDQNIPMETLHPIAQIDSPESIKSSVIRGLGVSVISGLAVQEEVREGRLLSFDLHTGGAFRSIDLIWRRDLQLTAMEEAFIRYVRRASMQRAQIL